MNLVKGIPVSFGTIEGMVFGGPFRNYKPGTRRLVGIKMAQEIDHPHDFKVDTEDYSVPSQADMQAGIMFALENLSVGRDIYAGCMGGIGRTGLFMACMAKVMIEYSPMAGMDYPVPPNPVAYVRAHYLSHAVETNGQQAFVAAFDTAPALKWLEDYHYVPKPLVTTHTIEVPVEKVVYLGPVSWTLYTMRKMFGG